MTKKSRVTAKRPIENVELVHPNNVQDTNFAQVTTMNVSIATRKDIFVEQLFVHILKREIQPAMKRVTVIQQIPPTGNQTYLMRAQTPIQISKQPRYLVNIVIKEKTIEAFADTGADISVMSIKSAQSIKLPLTRRKIKIQSYGSKPLKCLGYYDGTVMYGTTVAICLYVVKPNVETLLSGKVCEELGNITINSRPPNTSDQKVRSIDPDDDKATLVTNFPNVFHSIGKFHSRIPY